jgi:hypothetical protein
MNSCDESNNIPLSTEIEKSHSTQRDIPLRLSLSEYLDEKNFLYKK